jgi:hypothetical protein
MLKIMGVISFDKAGKGENATFAVYDKIQYWQDPETLCKSRGSGSRDSIDCQEIVSII